MAAGDRNNFSGDVHVTAATGGYTKGQVYLVADAYMVARETAAAAASCLMCQNTGSECIEVTKATGTGKSFVVGDKVYVKSNKLENATSTGAVLMPWTVVEAAAASATSVKVQIPGGIPPTAT